MYLYSILYAVHHMWLADRPNPRIAQNLDDRLIELFCKSLIREVIKKLYKYHLTTFKKYAFVQNFKVVAQKLSLLRHSEIWTLKPQKNVPFRARTFYFWKNVYFIKIYKCYKYWFFCSSCYFWAIFEIPILWFDSRPQHG